MSIKVSEKDSSTYLMSFKQEEEGSMENEMHAWRVKIQGAD